MDAEIWILRNAYGRRNLSDFYKAETALRLKDKLAEQAKENQKTHTQEGYQKSDKAVHTMPELAKLAGVSHDTIYKVGKIKEKGTPELIQMARGEEISIAAAADLAELPEEEQKAIL